MVLTVEPSSGQIGDAVTIYGNDLYLGQNPMFRIYFSDKQVDLSGVDKYAENELTSYWFTQVTSSIVDNCFAQTVIIPSYFNNKAVDEDGTYYFYLAKHNGTINKYVLLKGEPFELTGFFEVSFIPSEGHVGQELEISGEGFLPGEDIQILFAGVDITTGYVEGAPQALSSGALSVVIPVPAGIYGEKQVTVVGESSGITATGTFTVLPKITLSPSFGESGSAVVVNGSGFYENADIYFDETLVASVEVASGSFTEEIELPADLELGTYAIRAQDPLAPEMIFASANFEVTDPLVAPEPLEPANGEQEVPVNPVFIWSLVEVAQSYDFQLSLDPGFETDILVDENLSYAFYANTSLELDGDTYYYWRVRAVGEDEATSPWSVLRNIRTVAETTAPVEITQTITVTAPPVTTTVSVTAPPLTVTQTQPPLTVTRTNEVTYTTTAPSPTITMTQPPLTLTQTEVVEQPPVTVTQTIEPAEPADGGRDGLNWAMIAMFLGGAVMAAGGLVILIDRIRY
ncbi:MAG: hypothetical protein GX602_00550 [Dehalococcoidales bacterium]|nr:hypothetical protein [Dehalococcoidales bacterium]